jgi:hypothetical protein
MIYQLYFNHSHLQRLFLHPLYSPFGLEPEVNPDIENCKFLKHPDVRFMLSEYGAMLYLNEFPDDDTWIGFTSYRQLDKEFFVFGMNDRQVIERLLEKYHILGWRFREHKMCLYRADNSSHPYHAVCMEAILNTLGYKLPRGYKIDQSALYCNYWIMSKTDFNHYMRWSWPILKWMITHYKKIKFLKDSAVNHYSGVGIIMERLFIVWYYIYKKSLFDLPKGKQFNPTY